MGGDWSGLDLFIAGSIAVLLLSFVAIIRSYTRGLGGSPRELYLILFTKFIEYSAFAACMLSYVLYLSYDVGLSDLGAGSYVGTWMVAISALMMLVGAVCDVVGIKRTLLFGTVALLIESLANTQFAQSDKDRDRLSRTENRALALQRRTRTAFLDVHLSIGAYDVHTRCFAPLSTYLPHLRDPFVW